MTAALSAPLTWALPAAILLLALAMVLTLLRMLHGPTAQDRVLALDCMYLNGMLLVLVLAMAVVPTQLNRAMSKAVSKYTSEA